MEIKRNDSLNLRAAYKSISDHDLDETAIEGDYVDIRYRSASGGEIQTFLAIHKNGKQIARIPITNSTIKKFKKDFERLRVLIGVERKFMEGSRP